MRRIRRLVLLTALLGAAPVLAGCENFDMDKLDVFNLNEKKKLPGERRELFPGGVPGVSQGMPPEYLKGHEQDQPGAAIALPAPQPGAAPAGDQSKTAAVAPAAEPAKPAAKPKQKAKAKPKPKPKTKTAAPAAAPAPQPAPAQQQLAPWPASAPPQQQNDPAWPSAPPPGTFSR